MNADTIIIDPIETGEKNTKPKTDRKTYMREYKRKQYAEKKDYIKEINKKSYYKNVYGSSVEDISKYKEHLPTIMRIKKDLQKIPIEIIVMMLNDYNATDEIIV